MAANPSSAALRIVLTVLAGCLCGALPAQDPQDPQAPGFKIEGEEFVWSVDENDGLSIGEFVKFCEQITGRVFTVDQQELAGAAQKKISWIGTRRMARGEFFGWFQTMLYVRGFALIPRGTGGTEVWEVVSLTGQKVRELAASAKYVPTEQISDYAGQTGVQILTTVPLHHINATLATNSLRPFFAASSGGAASAGGVTVGNVGNQRFMILQGYGPQVYAAYQLLQLVDKEEERAQVLTEVVPLEYAAAEEVQPTLEDLLTQAARQPTGQQQNSGDPSDSVELKIVALIPQNAVVFSGNERQVNEARELLAKLDLPQEASTSDIHVVPLKNVLAGDLRETLREFLDADQSAERQAQQGTPGGQQQRRQRRTVIQDFEDTNSLLVSGTATKYRQILDLIEQLDRRQPQVLIEAAVVELATTDITRFGFELGLIDLADNGDFTRPFGFTSYGISEFQDTDDDGLADTRLPSLTNPLQGLTGGIVSGGDFAIPVLVNALSQDNRANILSLPSVLVNNNGNATVRTVESRPTTQNVQNASTATTGVGTPREAGITLQISPTISSSNYLRLNINLEVSRFQGAFDPNSPTGGGVTVTRQISTQVTMPSNDTMVLGGVIEDREAFDDSGVPVLKDIPILGWLFKTETSEQTKTNLYFFVTPRILDEPDFSDLRSETLRRKMEAERYIGKDRLQIVDREWTGNSAVAPTLEDPDSTSADMDAQGNHETPFYIPRNQLAEPTVKKGTLPEQKKP